MTEWSLTASVLIVLVLGIRAVLKNRISARLRYALWALVLVRLLVPVTPFSSPLSLLNAVEGGTAPAAVTQSGAVSAQRQSLFPLRRHNPPGRNRPPPRRLRRLPPRQRRPERRARIQRRARPGPGRRPRY